MSTNMEFSKTIEDFKKGKAPKELVEEFPAISQILLRMVKEDPKERPSLKELS
jgi:hypothetical protein